MSADALSGRTPADEREAKIRRKLARTAAMVRTRILLLDPDVKARRRAELDGYLRALAAWEAGEGSWPPTPEHIFAGGRHTRPLR